MGEEAKAGQEVCVRVHWPSSPTPVQENCPVAWEIISDNGSLMMLGLIELVPRSRGSEPRSLRMTHLHPAASHTHTPSWEWQGSVFPPSPSFYSSTKILMAVKSMLPLLRPNGTSWPWPMQRIPSGRACWPAGIHRFDYEEGQRCFSGLSHKEGLVQHQDNGSSKWHVKLTRLCAIIQAFDLTNVFLPSSTSANTSTFLHPLFSWLSHFHCQKLCQRELVYTSLDDNGRRETKKRTIWRKERKCWARR